MKFFEKFRKKQPPEQPKSQNPPDDVRIDYYRNNPEYNPFINKKNYPRDKYQQGRRESLVTTLPPYVFTRPDLSQQPPAPKYQPQDSILGHVASFTPPPVMPRYTQADRALEEAARQSRKAAKDVGESMERLQQTNRQFWQGRDIRKTNAWLEADLWINGASSRRQTGPLFLHDFGQPLPSTQKITRELFGPGKRNF